MSTVVVSYSSLTVACYLWENSVMQKHDLWRGSFPTPMLFESGLKLVIFDMAKWTIWKNPSKRVQHVAIATCYCVVATVRQAYSFGQHINFPLNSIKPTLWIMYRWCLSAILLPLEDPYKCILYSMPLPPVICSLLWGINSDILWLFWTLWNNGILCNKVRIFQHFQQHFHS